MKHFEHLTRIHLSNSILRSVKNYIELDVNANNAELATQKPNVLKDLVSFLYENSVKAFEFVISELEDC